MSDDLRKDVADAVERIGETGFIAEAVVALPNCGFTEFDGLQHIGKKPLPLAETLPLLEAWLVDKGCAKNMTVSKSGGNVNWFLDPADEQPDVACRGIEKITVEGEAALAAFRKVEAQSQNGGKE